MEILKGLFYDHNRTRDPEQKEIEDISKILKLNSILKNNPQVKEEIQREI